MSCELCDYYRRIKLPGMSTKADICQLTDREVDPKACDCSEFVPVFTAELAQAAKKPMD